MALKSFYIPIQFSIPAVCLSLSLLFSCMPPEHKSALQGTNPVVIVTPDTSIASPDPFAVRERLFRFFAKHKENDAFDTTDQTIIDYWGTDDYAYSYVKAGHLFTDKQVHAVIFYTDTASAGMFVYLKEGNNWRKIYGDTAANPHTRLPTFKDWNADGIKDISRQRREVNETINTAKYYDLWLLSPDGKTVNAIRDFSDIPNPITKKDGQIKSTYPNLGATTIADYRFVDYKLVEVGEKTVGMQ